MAIPFNREELIGAVQTRRPVRTPILDRHFPAGQQFGTDKLNLDVQKSPEGLAVAISAGSESQRAQQEGWESTVIQVPRFSEHDIVMSRDEKELRIPGAKPEDQTPLMQHVARKTDAIRSRFDRTKEYMAVKALQGQLEDGGGNVIATYDVPGATGVAFNTDGSGDDPLDVFDQQVTDISRALGGMPANIYAYAGATAYRYLRDEGRLRDLLRNQYGEQMVRSGQVPPIENVSIEKMPAVFTDNTGAEQPFVPEDEIIIAADEMDGETLFGPCEAPDGLRLQQWFVDQWEIRDPAGTVVRVETNPLPLVRRPASIRRLTVSQNA